MSGDWNFVERQEDKSNMNGCIISMGESRIFTLLKDALNVDDYFPIDARLRFSWNNRRKSGLWSLARLHRCCAFQQSGARASHVTEYSIRGDCSHGEHLLVHHTIQLLLPMLKKSVYKMNSFHFSDPKIQYEILRIWNQNPQLSLRASWREWKKFTKCSASQKPRKEKKQKWS